MRPTARRQSALRCPLNHFLGTEASVRVLRVLFLSDIPIGVSELARQAELQASGVARICTRLEDLGVIEAVGRGAMNRQYRPAPRFAFRDLLAGLFAQERGRAEQVLGDIRSAVRHDANIRAAWIEGPVVRGTDGPGDPIVVGALVEPADVDAVRAALWRQLLDVQRSRDVVLELRVRTAADLKTARSGDLQLLEDVLPLLGPPPLDLVNPTHTAARAPGNTRRRRHADLDVRALAVARVLAERIRRDPSLIDEAKRYIERRIPLASPGERLELEEWLEVLSTMSVVRLCRFMAGTDARATRLRQSSPFLGVLSPAERRGIFADQGRPA